MPEYEITSPRSLQYNCIAWAAKDEDRWWWPAPPGTSYWPEGVPREVTLDAFIQAFNTLGYQPCEDTQYQQGFEKVAIFVNDNGIPTHVARQLNNGKWTSKLGRSYDIKHNLEELTSFVPSYGNVAIILRRPSNFLNYMIKIFTK